MNKKIITVRESYDWIKERDVGPNRYEALIEYIEKKHPNKRMVEQGYKQLRFINYVGVIACADIRYEIIPKISMTKEDDRQSLLLMLSITNFLPITFYKKIQNGEGKSDLLSTFLGVFLERLLTELKRGVYKTYETSKDNLNILKGKLELTQHIQKNAFHKTKAYCSFDEYITNNTLNQLIKTALFIVQQDTKQSMKKLTLERCLGYLEDVNILNFSINQFNHVNFNRQNERFKNVALFAKMIIEHASIYSYGKQSSSFSFLFPMNLLFEEYIGVGLKEVCVTDKTTSQHAEKRLLKNKKTGRANILLKPDFVINDRLIVDTKWKSATNNGRTTYQQSDIYQMYAYVTAYQNVNRCILLYPQQDEEVNHPLWEVIDTDKTIEMHTVKLTDYRTTIEALKKIVLDNYR